MTIIVNGEEKKVCMMTWEDNQWSCDFFGDIEINVSDGDEMTEDEYKEFIRFWTSEVDSYNNGDRSECLGERYIDTGDEDEHDNGEIGFFAD